MHISFATEAASGQVANEDFIAATPTAVVLLDGAGNSGNDCGCSHGVAWYARQLGTALIARLNAEDLNLRQTLADGIEHVAGMHRSTCDLAHPGSPSATVLMLRQTVDSLEYLVLADSAFVLGQGDTVTVITDDREAQIGQRYRHEMDTTPGGTPAHDQARRTYVERMRAHRNQVGGFWVASSIPAAADEAVTGSVALDQVSAVALLSDGASRLVDRFGLADWPRLLDILAIDGPAALIRQVRAAEANDPHGKRWPRGKIRDDATAAYCSSLRGV